MYPPRLVVLNEHSQSDIVSRCMSLKAGLSHRGRAYSLDCYGVIMDCYMCTVVLPAVTLCNGSWPYSLSLQTFTSNLPRVGIQSVRKFVRSFAASRTLLDVDDGKSRLHEGRRGALRRRRPHSGALSGRFEDL